MLVASSFDPPLVEKRNFSGIERGAAAQAAAAIEDDDGDDSGFTKDFKSGNKKKKFQATSVSSSPWAQSLLLILVAIVASVATTMILRGSEGQQNNEVEELRNMVRLLAENHRQEAETQGQEGMDDGAAGSAVQKEEKSWAVLGHDSIGRKLEPVPGGEGYKLDMMLAVSPYLDGSFGANNKATQLQVKALQVPNQGVQPPVVFTDQRQFPGEGMPEAQPEGVNDLNLCRRKSGISTAGGGAACVVPVKNKKTLWQQAKSGMSAKGALSGVFIGALQAVNGDPSDVTMWIGVAAGAASMFGPVGMAVSTLFSLVTLFIPGQEQESMDVWGMVEENVKRVASQAVINTNLKEAMGALRSFQSHMTSYYNFKHQSNQEAALESLFMMIQASSEIFHKDFEMDSYEIDFSNGCDKLHCQLYEQILFFMPLHLSVLEVAAVELPGKEHFYSKQLMLYAHKYETFLKEYTTKLKAADKSKFVKIEKLPLYTGIRRDGNAFQMVYAVRDIFGRFGVESSSQWNDPGSNSITDQYILDTYYSTYMYESADADVNAVWRKVLEDHESKILPVLYPTDGNGTAVADYSTGIIHGVFGGVKGIFNASENDAFLYGFCTADDDCLTVAPIGVAYPSQSDSSRHAALANDGLSHTKTTIFPESDGSRWWELDWNSPAEISHIAVEFGNLSTALSNDTFGIFVCSSFYRNDTDCVELAANDTTKTYWPYSQDVFQLPRTNTTVSKVVLRFSNLTSSDVVELAEVKVFEYLGNRFCDKMNSNGIGVCQKPAEPGLRHHYDFSEWQSGSPKLYDHAGGKNAEAKGNYQFSHSFSLQGRLNYLKTGSGGYVRLPDNLLKQKNWGKDVTIEMWVKQFNSNGVYIRAFDIGTTDSTSGAAKDFWNLVLDSNGDDTQFFMEVVAAGTVETNTVFSQSAYRKNELAHLAITYDDSLGHINIYKDGALLKVIKLSANFGLLSKLGKEVFLGKSHQTQDSHTFEGEFHDVKIYNKALSASEVAASYLDYLPRVGGPSSKLSNALCSGIGTSNPLLKANDKVDQNGCSFSKRSSLANDDYDASVRFLKRAKSVTFQPGDTNKHKWICATEDIPTGFDTDSCIASIGLFPSTQTTPFTSLGRWWAKYWDSEGTYSRGDVFEMSILNATHIRLYKNGEGIVTYPNTAGEPALFFSIWMREPDTSISLLDVSFPEPLNASFSVKNVGTNIAVTRSIPDSNNGANMQAKIMGDYGGSGWQHNSVDGLIGLRRGGDAHMELWPSSSLALKKAYSMSVGVWLRLADATGGPVFDFGSTLVGINDATNYWTLVIESNSLKVQVKKNGVGVERMNIAVAPNVWEWYYFAATYEGHTRTVNVYMDGTSVGSGVLPVGYELHTLFDDNVNFKIGKSNNPGVGGSGLLSADISEITVSDTALDANQIQNAFLQGPQCVDGYSYCLAMKSCMASCP